MKPKIYNLLYRICGKLGRKLIDFSQNCLNKEHHYHKDNWWSKYGDPSKFPDYREG